MSGMKNNGEREEENELFDKNLKEIEIEERQKCGKSERVIKASIYDLSGQCVVYLKMAQKLLDQCESFRKLVGAAGNQ